MNSIKRWMAIMGLCASGVALGCSGDDQQPMSDEAPETGVISMALIAQGGDGVLYRLVDASFEINGPESATLDPADDDEVATVDVVVGSYDVELLDGWTMQRDEGSGFEPVAAALDSDNPQTVEVEALLVTDVSFQFRAGDDVIEFGHGRISITIDVNASGSGGPAATVNCFGDECSVGDGEVCCFDGPAQVGACVAAALCVSPAAPLACDETSDCASGESCCLNSAAVICQSGPCEVAPLCSLSNPDCPAGTSCVDVSAALGLPPGTLLEGACQ